MYGLLIYDRQDHSMTGNYKVITAKGNYRHSNPLSLPYVRRLAPKVLHPRLGVLACLAGAELLVPTSVPELDSAPKREERPPATTPCLTNCVLPSAWLLFRMHGTSCGVRDDSDCHHRFSMRPNHRCHLSCTGALVSNHATFHHLVLNSECTKIIIRLRTDFLQEGGKME